MYQGGDANARSVDGPFRRFWVYHLGLSEVRGSVSIMNPRTRWYVLIVALVATACGFALYLRGPAPTASALPDSLLLIALAAAAEGLYFLLPRSAVGSMAFIPYFALAITVPSWESVVAVAALRAALEFYARRELTKALFNISAHALMETVAIVIYLALGGKSFTSISDVAHLAHVTKVVGTATLISAAAGLMTNNLLVTGVVAVASER